MDVELQQSDAAVGIKPVIFKRITKLMGNRFEITVVRQQQDVSLAEEDLDAAVAEIARIEKLLTTFAEDSDTNRVNASAGIAPVRVSEEMFRLVQRCQRISAITQGAFDISYGSLDKGLWNFDKTMSSLPDQATASAMVRLINYRNIITDENNFTIYLKEKGMRIGFGGIGKGYAADRAKLILQNRGVQSGIVNASGDLTVWGLQPDGKPWTVGIANPEQAHQPFAYMQIAEMAVATSGNYEKYVMIDGKKYSHTIDPKTGLPVHGIKSVTIFSPIAELADAMATPVTVMGIEPGLAMINQMKNMGCIIIDENDQIFTSTNINLH